MNVRLIAPVIMTMTLASFAPLTLAGTSYADVQRFSDDGVVDGSSTLLRTDEGVAYTLNTRELGENFAYTNWFVNFNNPEDCATPCACGGVDFDDPKVEIGVFWATGRVSDKFGQAEFAAHTDYGELPTGDDQVPFDPDFTNPIEEGAEIHLIVRSHLEASTNPEELEKQLTEFNGLCFDENNMNVCVDVQFAVHSSPSCELDDDDDDDDDDD